MVRKPTPTPSCRAIHTRASARASVASIASAPNVFSWLEEADRIVPVVVIGGRIGGRPDDAEIGRIGLVARVIERLAHATFTIAALSGSSFANARW